VTSPPDSPAANVALLRASFQDFNDGDLDACVARLAPDFVINLAELPQPMRGRDTWRQGAETMKRAFPDIAADIHDMVAAEDRVAVRITLRGTHSGDFLGVAGTGRRVEYVSHEFYRVADGLLAEEWICSDFATLMQRIT
jgi:steroid delta-isomerase-like uncharacterized protein